ncbi:MAG TPA: hypothetical protein VHP30_06500 [Ignavibacteriales bacterium]|jgi:uncharacterized protein YoxC|nr:hypothetical protein [Ignavibacteriales bacterium]
MSGINEVLITILLISATALCIYLIYSLNKITNAIVSIQKDINDIAKHSMPLIEKLSELGDRISDTVGDINEQINSIKTFINSIKGKVTGIFDKGREVRETAEDTAHSFISNFLAFKRGFSVFWSKLRNK